MYLSKKSILSIVVLSSMLSACNDKDSASNSKQVNQAERILAGMSLEEKVAQKIMMSFRYWCDDTKPNCQEGLTKMNAHVRSVIQDDKIGGIILFSDNQFSLESIAQLIFDMQDAVPDEQPLGLFMTVDQEGGNVVRLPRSQATNMPGNMALGAAYLGTKDETLALDYGRVIGSEVSAVGFNVNFAPLVDVQSNPLNPVINVRAFGESVDLVAKLAGGITEGMAEHNVIGAFKHFPGHGDTATDSHLGLPIVHKKKEAAYQTDLKPYKLAIEQRTAPDMIMTAHIQYPALDSTTFKTKTGEDRIVPATISRKIQHDILRGELGYQGLTITDALNMRGIRDHLSSTEMVIKIFEADVDIALMPVEFDTKAHREKVTTLITEVVEAVKEGRLNEKELDSSVLRIIQTKLKRSIINRNRTIDFASIKKQISNTVGSQKNKAIEQKITRQSLTVLKGLDQLPLEVSDLGRIHILTPWGEQGVALKQALISHGVTEDDVTSVKMSKTTLEQEKTAMDVADTVIVGTRSTKPYHHQLNQLPQAITTLFAHTVEDKFEDSSRMGPQALRANAQPRLRNEDFAYEALNYAKAQHKRTILISMRSPYDISGYQDKSDIAVATYGYYGLEKGHLRGPALPEAVNLFFGKYKPTGRLPVTIKSLKADGRLGEIVYPYGFGQSEE
ncbi:glycoside hydrolase family 3 protein [Algicola sagamiensis]|uniref:glycoside hydrolase family 3 protein n=1 Tax=Algicola sagamiensis TaxID=163869 RepID=UPI00039FBC0A|nr:glycoside hydrolase family 3 protein [Algicola sagamiensis]